MSQMHRNLVVSTKLVLLIVCTPEYIGVYNLYTLSNPRILLEILQFTKKGYTSYPILVTTNTECDIVSCHLTVDVDIRTMNIKR